MKKIQKPAAFIMSAGRTGTRFFGETLQLMIPEAYSVHEPDVMKGLHEGALRKVRIFGLNQVVFGKLLGKTGIRSLSLNYISKKISLHQLVNKIYKFRNTYYASIDKPMIIESYYGWFGAIPGIKELFSDYKIVIIVRDPRQWATSYMNTTSTMYGPKNLRYRLGINLFNPTLLGDMEYSDKWNAMNRFEKLCWAWQAIYSILLKELGDEHVLLIKFEDIFLDNNRYNELERLLIFLTTFPSRNFEYRITKGLLENPINRSTGKEFPKWHHWDPANAKYLHSLCSPLMGKFGYGQEDEWLEMVNHSPI